MGRILVIGSYNQDTVLRVPRFPSPGETLSASMLDRFHGGKGSNQAVAAARAGGDVAIAAALGGDAAGAAALALWSTEGIGTTAVVRHAAAATGEALILLDTAGENEIVIHAGANALLAPEATAAAARGAAVLVAQLETPVAATLAAFTAAPGASRILNAAPAAALPGPLLAATDLLVVNETEAQHLAGRSGSPAELAARLGPRFALGAVVTAGAGGAHWAGRGAPPLHVPARPVEVVDTTGAGDAFVGALAAGLAEGQPLAAALQRGVVAGALACGRLGAVPSLPRRAEIEAAGGWVQ